VRLEDSVVSRDDSGLEYRWAILITVPDEDYREHTENALVSRGTGPLTFATIAEVRAAERDPKLQRYFIHQDYWISSVLCSRPPEAPARGLARVLPAVKSPTRVFEERCRLALEKQFAAEADARAAAREAARADASTAEKAAAAARRAAAEAAAEARDRADPVIAHVPPALRTVYYNLTPHILEQYEKRPRDGSSFVMFAALDTLAPQGMASLAQIPAELGRELCGRGSEALREFESTLLDPARQADAGAQLGWSAEFRPNVVLLVREVWCEHEFDEGHLRSRIHDAPHAGALHTLQVEMHTHAAGSVAVRWSIRPHGQDTRVVTWNPRVTFHS
jgi:hypothetical protein